MEVDYEAVDYDDPMHRVPLPMPIKLPEPLPPRGSGKMPALPPGKPRYTKDPVNRPPLLSMGKKPPVNTPSTAPKPATMPSSAPPTSKRPAPVKKRNESLPTKIRSASQDSNGHFGLSADPRQWRDPSPTTCSVISPPVPDRGDKAMLLPDLVRKHSKELPLRVRVEEGYCGAEERFVISSGDIYNFHFVKNEKVVSVSDCGSNHFSIPFNSEIKFGLLYNPNDNFKEAIEGHTFKSVSDLVSAPTTPRIVRVLTSSPKISPAKSLVKSDLLVIRKAGRTLMRKPFIKVFSFNSQEEKTLYDDSENSFTTEPRSLQLYIPEIIEHFPDSFPLAAMMYPPGEDAEDLPPHLTTDIVTLAHTSIESAIIATTHWEEEESRENIDDDEQIPISIPIEMDIEVTILTEADEDELYLDTKTLLQHLDLTKVKDMKDDGAANNEDAEGGRKRKLSRRVRKGYEFRGVNITVSEKVSDDPGLKSAAFRSILNQPLPAPPLGLPSESPTPPKCLSPLPTPQHKSHPPIKPSISVPPRLSPSQVQPPVPLPPSRGRSLDDATASPKQPRVKPRSSTIAATPLRNSMIEGDYMNNDEFDPTPFSSSTLPPPRSSRLSLPIAGPKVDSENASPLDVTKINDNVEFLRRLVTVMQDNSLKDTTFLREEVKSLTTRVDTLSEHCKQLQSEVDQLQMVNQQAPNGHFSVAKSMDSQELTKTMDPQRQKENMANLRAMGIPEILCLLEVMKLTQYKQLFLEESIDGEILAECDEELLEQELQISNKLHRSRLLKIITGRHSVTNIEHGLDPYAAI